MSTSIRVGTRASRLALIQTEAVVDALRTLAPDAQITLEKVRTTGDKQPTAPLTGMGTGVFTSALEDALLEGRIDIAVHSLKDLPTMPTPGVTVLTVLEREDPRDVLIDRWGASLLDLPAGARIGTSSPRRAAQLRHGRKDVDFVPIRGNVETRVAKSGGPDHDGVVLAAAGLRRLGMADDVSEYLSHYVCAPAPGQGALAVQVRSDDAELVAMVSELTHAPTAAAVAAERALLRAAGSGCQLPIGALATVEGEELTLFATATPSDGSVSYRVEVTVGTDAPELAGTAAYQGLVDQGAGEIVHPEGTR